jgi:hypothetical protein
MEDTQPQGVIYGRVVPPAGRLASISKAPSLETENAALPPGKTAFLILPYHNPHLWNSGKAYESMTNEISIAENHKNYSGDVLYFL